MGLRKSECKGMGEGDLNAHIRLLRNRAFRLIHQLRRYTT